MLVKLEISEWNGPSPQSTRKKKISSSNTEYWVLNTTNIFDLETDNTTGSKFSYVDNLWGIRSHGNTVKAIDSTSTIKTSFDATYEHEYIDLPVYEDNNEDNSTTTKAYPAASISMACADERDSTRCWVYYCRGSELKKLLVDYSLAAIVYLADIGSTTTSA